MFRFNGSAPKLSERAATSCWENLNKLSWKAGFSLESYGVDIGVRVTDPSVIPVLVERLPKFSNLSSTDVVERYFSVVSANNIEGSRRRNYNLLYQDHSLLARTFDFAELLNSFETWVRLGIGQLSRDRIFVHAGVVGWKNKAILIPGKTHSGKTTLVIELVKAGATYYSDDFAVLDERGRVFPYLNDLSVRDGSPTQKKIRIDEIAGREATKPLPVGLVIASAYEPGAIWKPVRLSPGRATLALLENMVTARSAPGKLLDTMSKIVVDAPVLKGRRGDAAETAAMIISALERSVG